jgi:hypothetical protein
VGQKSSQLRNTMAQFAKQLSNVSPDYALYRAATITRLVALNKEPGVQPAGIGDIFMQLWSHIVHAATKPADTSMCAELQLCCGLKSGIKASLHALWHVFPQSNGWQNNNAEEAVPEAGTDVAQSLRPSATNLHPDNDPDPGAALNQSHSH